MDHNNHKNHNSFDSFLHDYFNFFLAGVLILFFALAYWLLLGPKFQATETAIRMNIDDQEKIYVSEQGKLANLKAMMELYKKISPADLQKFNGVLPNSYVPERLFGELEEVIGKGGWSINSLEIIKPEDSAKAAPAATVDENGNPLPASAQTILEDQNKDLGQVHLRLSLGAVDYAGLKNLLRLLENNLRLFNITNVSFSPTTGVATLDLITYYYQPAP